MDKNTNSITKFLSKLILQEITVTESPTTIRNGVLVGVDFQDFRIILTIRNKRNRFRKIELLYPLSWRDNGSGATLSYRACDFIEVPGHIRDLVSVGNKNPLLGSEVIIAAK